MSYNHALPVQFTSPFQERTKHARAFLDHPMTNIWDTRCVLALELLEVREPLFRPFQSILPSGAELDDLLREANHGIMERYEYWLEYYRSCSVTESHDLADNADRAGLASDHYLVKECEFASRR